MTDISSTSAGSPAYAELVGLLREAATLNSAISILGWDQETQMPDQASPLRAEQMAALSAIVHERRTSARVGELIAACECDAALADDPAAAANLAAIRRDYERATRLPPELVREIAETSSRAMHVWREAREKNDFAAFAPWLEKTVALNRATAEAFGWPEGGERYDALLETFEPGMTTAEITRTFDALRAGLAPLIHAVTESGVRPDVAWQRTPVPVARQAAFNRALVTRMGFDFGAGRIDESTHPFCDGIGPGDTRLTTRYAEDQFASALASSMHETGHALYEQNLPKADGFGQPLAEAASTGIHESQSRMWENFVGRSRPFWEWVLPELRAAFGPGALDGLDVETAYRGMNVVEPNLIRIESDEATYNLHIMLRFDLERAMLSGDLRVADLPEAWNERIRADLGLAVPDDARGCMQDIHWSMGSFGYFPTYTLGNLYAAQFWVTLREALPGLDDDLRRGEFGGLLAWLKAQVHVHGRRFTAPELCERITGRRLSHEPLLDYLRAKIEPIYGL
ncbi:MAG TPA: carboxypeptidase M32 [Longimicrobiaceae bacterium]|nr:carboxypeptidase M32 [Longimicrobiaceae bacterium]